MAKGKITVHRKGYHRGPYTMHRNGKTIHVKRHYVPPTTYQIKDRGKKGKGKDVIGELKEGELSEHGYDINKPASERRDALKEDIQEDGAETTWKRLNAMVVMRKNKKGKAYKRFKADRDWVSRKYDVPGKPSEAIEEWESMSESERKEAMPSG